MGCRGWPCHSPLDSTHRLLPCLAHIPLWPSIYNLAYPAIGQIPRLCKIARWISDSISGTCSSLGIGHCSCQCFTTFKIFSSSNCHRSIQLAHSQYNRRDPSLRTSGTGHLRSRRMDSDTLCGSGGAGVSTFSIGVDSISCWTAPAESHSP